MIKILFGIFIVLHGLVHLLYMGQSARFFELQPGMVWPDNAWAFSALVGMKTTRKIANTCLILSALLFAIGGAGLLARQDWWRLVATSAAIVSSAIFFLLWDGTFKKLPDQGWVGILINLAILAVIFLFKWPKF